MNPFALNTPSPFRHDTIQRNKKFTEIKKSVDRKKVSYPSPNYYSPSLSFFLLPLLPTMKGLLLFMPFLAVVSGMRLSPMVNNMALSKTIEIHGLTKEVLY